MVNYAGKNSLEGFMKNAFILLLMLAAVSILASCEAGDTGNFKIRVRLPIDYYGYCGFGDDHDYCISRDDQILLSIYSTTDPTEQPYMYTDRRLFRVRSDKGGKEEFIRSLKSGNYYRFFVEVTNVNEKLKLTGGIDGVYYEDSKNYEVNILLGAVGDFVRVVKDRSRSETTSVKTYFDTYGSSGAGAAALKNGDLFLSGGYSYDYDNFMNNTMIIDTKQLTSKEVAKMPSRLRDHAVAFLDDKTEKGKVVIAFGETDFNSYSNQILMYDPESNRYRDIGYRDAVTMARAISINGDVYIVGGCTTNQPNSKIHRVSYNSDTKTVELNEYATLKQGRCNHSIADVSTFDENGNMKVKILVFGGSTDVKGENPVLNDNFAELVAGNVSNLITIEDRFGADNAELLSRGLVFAGASRVGWDDPAYGPDAAVVALGGFILDGEGDNAGLINNKNIIIFSEKNNDTWVYDVNGAPNDCARPSMTRLSSAEKSIAQYAAVNCGSNQFARGSSNTTNQVVFVVQVRKAFDNELERSVLSASVKDSLMDDSRDPENGVIVDGPAVTNNLGQAFVFGTEYVYQLSGYALPVQ